MREAKDKLSQQDAQIRLAFHALNIRREVKLKHQLAWDEATSGLSSLQQVAIPLNALKDPYYRSLSVSAALGALVGALALSMTPGGLLVRWAAALISASIAGGSIQNRGYNRQKSVQLSEIRTLIAQICHIANKQSQEQLKQAREDFFTTFKHFCQEQGIEA
jgi:hypothetical protein